MPPPARRFVEAWLDRITSERAVSEMTSSHAVRAPIAERARKLKGVQTRRHDQAPFEIWSGAAGLRQFEYRWSSVRLLSGEEEDHQL